MAKGSLQFAGFSRGENKSVRLTIDHLIQGDIHELHFDGVRSADGRPILHPLGHYTLNEIPEK
jgi:hypothetical protein